MGCISRGVYIKIRKETTRMEEELGEIAKVLQGVFISPNELDRNLEDANVVDGLFAIARALNRIGKSLEGNEN